MKKLNFLVVLFMMVMPGMMFAAREPQGPETQKEKVARAQADVDYAARQHQDAGPFSRQRTAAELATAVTYHNIVAGSTNFKPARGQNR